MLQSSAASTFRFSWRNDTIARPFFKVTLSTRLAPCITTRLTGDYRDRTYTGKCSPALLETRIKKVQKQFPRLCTFSHLLFAFFCLFYFSDC